MHRNIVAGNVEDICLPEGSNTLPRSIVASAFLAVTCFAMVFMAACSLDAKPEPTPEEPAAPHVDSGSGMAFIEPFDDPTEPLPMARATIRRGESEPDIVVNPSSRLVLVNKERNLPPDYAPEDLVRPNIPFPFEGELPRMMMRSEAAAAIEELVTAAGEEGLVIFGSSGYRSYETQRAIFESNVQRRGETEANRFSARPGQSEHQTGLAMDVTSPDVGYGLVQSFGDTAEGIWIEENAHEFGFIVRYPRDSEHITGYAYEPWHLRYVGCDHAKIIRDTSLTFEEYMQER